MPRLQKAMKDVVSCEKPRRAANRLRPGDVRMGQPGGLKARHRRYAGRTRGTETSQYPQEEKEKIDSPSSGERKGKSPNRARRGASGVVGPATELCPRNRNVLERAAAAGDSPLRATWAWRGRCLSMAGHVQSCQNPRGPSRKAKYSLKTDSGPVP